MDAARLEKYGILAMPMPGKPRHTLCGRGDYAALVERIEESKYSIGAAGKVTGNGLAMLVWRNEEAFFVSKAHEQRAESEEVSELRRFTADLESAFAKIS